jgi:hypothetical protein
MGYANIKDLLKTAFAALDAAKDVLPQGREREEMEARLREAASAMKGLDAELAKELQRNISGGDKGVNYNW